MPEKIKDPKYGHFIGDHKCSVPECQGHREKWQPSLHKIYEQNFTSEGQLRKQQRQEKAEAKIVTTISQRRTKGLTPRSTPEVKSDTQPKPEPEPKDLTSTPETPKKKRTLPPGVHFHKKRRGMCNCDNPNKIIN